ncbi:glycerol-3-phosphate acyltransferase [Neobacillus vireti]|uniref:Glycerol-3-phosphate acyltransferase n=1 Tax=Neobacillus vireti LMG 21834 TaxID=1131730 RepID=A0AB94INH6_9BACI|nr:glycerol-3-phosphate acyltransferase [Neobacillus vireti]ETI68587.1 putative glycerol-3-phosphate acyltransferase PlsY [Neobacillus vireti LMG 21834]
MIWLYLVFSYLIGNIMFGYLVIKILHHKDIRLHGSGNVGARNAGRLHGRKAFALIFLGDALKGISVILIARYLHLPEYVQLIGLGMAILGHIKPAALKFKGGKGISTFIGGMICFDPLLIAVILLAFFALYPFTKSFTFSGLGAFLFIPIFLIFKHYQWITFVIELALIAIIFLAHSGNIKERLKSRRQKG